MEEESFTQSLFDTPDDLAADGTLTVMRTEDFGAWYRRVQAAYNREYSAMHNGSVVDSMTDADLAEHGLCRIGSAAMWDELRDTKDRELSEEHGLVRLPVDADGLPIHIGDVMENIVCPSVHRTVTGVGVECFYAWEDGCGRYSQFSADCYRHHHTPTVEDVLREFADEVWNRCCKGATASDSGIDELVAECAAKLRLAGENA